MGGQTHRESHQENNREPFLCKGDEYSLSGIMFQRQQVWFSLSLGLLYPLTSLVGGVFAVFSSHWNCHGKGRHDFEYVNECILYFFFFLVKFGSTSLCWKQLVLADLLSTASLPISYGTAYLECLEGNNQSTKFPPPLTVLALLGWTCFLSILLTTVGKAINDHASHFRIPGTLYMLPCTE